MAHCHHKICKRARADELNARADKAQTNAERWKLKAHANYVLRYATDVPCRMK